MEIESKTYTGMSVTKSEPIAIPHCSSASILQVPAPLIEERNSVRVQYSHRMNSFSVNFLCGELE